MNEEKSCKEKVREDILKSGFPLELEVSNILESKEWVASPKEYILDRESDKEYELDIRGIKTNTSKTKEKNYDFVSSFNLYIECKKSEKHPWVFFTRKKKINELSGSIIKHIHNFGINKFFNISHSFFSDALYFESKVDYSKLKILSWEKVSTNYCVAFRKSSDENEIYKAIKNLFNSVKIRRLEAQNRYSGGRWANIILETFIPIVIFDGKLFEGFFSNGKLTVEECEYATLIYNTGDDRIRRLLIFIVKKEVFPNLLNNLEHDLNYLHNEFSNILPY